MDIGNCLRALVGSPELRGTRPTRTIIKVNFRQGIDVYSPRGWYRWSPGFNDLVAVDWEVMHERKLMEIIQAEMAAANSQAQAG